jgi:hypothetical protein
LPSLHHYLGVALYNLGHLTDATNAFVQAVTIAERDLGSWVHLGATFLHRFKVQEACEVFESMIHLNLTNDFSKLYAARAWICDWHGRDLMAAAITKSVHDRTARGRPAEVSSADFFDTNPWLLLEMTRHGANSQPMGAGHFYPSPAQLLDTRSQQNSSQLWPPLLSSPQGAKRLRLGFISADFGVHPVSSLIRGVMTRMATDTTHAGFGRFEVHCFALQRADSWWRRNVSSSSTGGSRSS